ncbi:MAG: hypothetical protein JWM87_77 [Candidatus Eremiobacteraeota bacterium]|nr:hypothetical protein [Candidatus Eremiobacteraeota bacterium]
MNTSVRCAVASALALLLSACAGGGTAAFSGPAPATPAPTTTPFVPDATARAAAQGALLAQQTAMLLLTTPGGPSYLSRRRAATARAPRVTVGCTGGFAEQDSSAGPGTTHAVISLYFDAACTSLRQRATLDRTLLIDTGQTTGTIDSFNPTGQVTVSQGVAEAWGIVTGTVRTVLDRVPGPTPTSPATLLGRSALSCPFAATSTQCSVAAVTDGPAFETGVVLTGTSLTGVPIIVSTALTVPFTGSLSTGAVGSMTIAQQPPQPPTLTGTTSAVPFSGSLTIAPGTDGPTTFSLALDTASMHVMTTFANGTTTVSVSGGITVTVNLNGDGTIAYPNGTSGTVLDFRIAG